MAESSRPRLHPLFFWLSILLGLCLFLHLIREILLPFVVGMALAYILDPLADRLEAKGLSRTASTTLISATFLAMTAILMTTLLPMLVDQCIALAAELPTYISQARTTLQPQLMHLTRQFQLNNAQTMKEISDSLTNGLKGIAGGLIQSSMAVLNVLALLIITPLVSFYLLRDWDKIMQEMDDLLPRRHAPIIREQCAVINRTLSAFVRGQLNVMLVLSVYYGITLSLASLNYALVVALLAALLIILPYIGTIISGAIAIGIAYAQFGATTDTLIVVAIFVFGQTMEGYVLTPRLIGRSVGLNPLWIIFGMLSGAAMMGFVGTLIAVPVTAVCGVLIRFAITGYRESVLYKGE